MPEEQKAFRVRVNEFEFSFSREEIEAANIITRSPSLFHLIKDTRSVNVELTEADATGKKLKLEADGESFDVEIKDELDQVLDQMGYSNTSSKQIKEIKAPMPGMVISITVQEGQELKEGERILILEAMKMENSILIHTNATIKRIAVSAGQAVEKGQLLVELD